MTKALRTGPDYAWFSAHWTDAKVAPRLKCGLTFLPPSHDFIFFLSVLCITTLHVLPLCLFPVIPNSSLSSTGQAGRHARLAELIVSHGPPTALEWRGAETLAKLAHASQSVGNSSLVPNSASP